MPETRYIEEYDNQGNITNNIPYEVSDEELERYARKWLLDDKQPKKKEGRLGRCKDEDGNIIDDDDDEI